MRPKRRIPQPRQRPPRPPSVSFTPRPHMSPASVPRRPPALLSSLASVLLFLTAISTLSAQARANYGHEPRELAAPGSKSEAPNKPTTSNNFAPVPNSVDDQSDASLRADDASFQKIDSQRDELNKKLAEIDRVRSRMLSKSERLKRVRSLEFNVSQALHESKASRRTEHAAEHDLSVAVQRKNATWDEKEAIARHRRSLEKVIRDLYAEKQAFQAEINKINDERNRFFTRENELIAERQRLQRQLGQLVTQFRTNGLHNWLEQHLAGLPPVVRETIVKTTSALDPVLRGVEEASVVTEEMSNDTTQALTRYVPAIRNSPFYSGLIFYIILLCPTVVAAWLILKIRASIALLTVEHGLIALNLYFGVLSTACAAMSLLGHADILLVFRHRSRHLAETFMLIHGFLFVLHLAMHGMTAYVTGSRKDFAQYISMSCVGLHFFMNAYKRTILDEDPNVGAIAYALYAAAFLYTLYDRGVHIIEAAVSGTKASAAEFSTFPTEPLHKNLPNGAGPPNSDSTVYFAGLPVFNGPSQSTVDDAKTI